MEPKLYEGYHILDPATIKYAERDDFIKSLELKIPAKPLPLEDTVVNIWNEQSTGKPVKAKVDVNTVQLAQDYIRYRDKQARLPAFSRWASGMFRDDATIAKDLAAAGKYYENNGDIVISGGLIDILRCADTPHFQSCFKVGGGYDDMPQKIAEMCPGIGIAFVDDEAGKMRGRCWVHHAKRLEDGVEVAVVCQKWGGTVDAKQIAEVIKEKGIPAYVAGSYGHEDGDTKVEFINCFTSPVHHDLYTWKSPYRVRAV
jgi:hypothetical protein